MSKANLASQRDLCVTYVGGVVALRVFFFLCADVHGYMDTHTQTYTYPCTLIGTSKHIHTNKNTSTHTTDT